MRIFSTALAGLLAFSTHVTGMAQAIDVSGITTGIAAAEVKALMLKANPAYKIEALTLADGDAVGIKGTLPPSPTTRTVDNMVVLINDAGKVWSVAREQSYPQGSFLPLEALQKAWNGKYGMETDTIIVDGFGKRWEMDRAGVIHRDRKKAGPCRTGNQSRDWDGLNNTRIKVLSKFDASCGRLLISQATLSGDDVISFTTTLIDVAVKYDERKLKDAADAAARDAKRKKDAGMKVNL